VRGRQRRGVALILVLWLVVVLSAIGTAVARAARTSTAVASNARADLIARAAAESGIELLVAAIEDTLAILSDPAERRDWLNSLPFTAGRDSVALGDGRLLVAVVDVSARLDVNAATETALGTFFSQFTDPAEAAAIARGIRSRIESGATPVRSGFAPSIVTPIRSLDELRTARLVPEQVLQRAVAYLTVDGDGVINQRSASDTVLVAAAGELRDEPGRLLIVSRGWMAGHPLPSEIQAVDSVVGNRLVFSHWRERTQ
jgi:general secretion pathway protein K